MIKQVTDRVIAYFLEIDDVEKEAGFPPLEERYLLTHIKDIAQFLQNSKYIYEKREENTVNDFESLRNRIK